MAILGQNRAHWPEVDLRLLAEILHKMGERSLIIFRQCTALFFPHFLTLSCQQLQVILNDH